MPEAETVHGRQIRGRPRVVVGGGQADDGSELDQGGGDRADRCRFDLGGVLAGDPGWVGGRGTLGEDLGDFESRSEIGTRPVAAGEVARVRF